MTRYRDLDLAGAAPVGTHNAIADVPGVRVGVPTLIEGEGALEIGLVRSHGRDRRSSPTTGSRSHRCAPGRTRSTATAR